MLENLTDEQLVAAAQAGDKQATEAILNRYKQFVKRRVRGFFLIGGDNDDLLQEGMIAVSMAIDGFQADKSSFASFASMCITRRIISVIKLSNGNKSRALNNAIPIFDEEGGDALTLYSLDNPEQCVIEKETADELMKTIKTQLSPLELWVLDLFMTGLSYEEISSRTGRAVKSVDNALFRAKQKINKLLA